MKMKFAYLSTVLLLAFFITLNTPLGYAATDTVASTTAPAVVVDESAYRDKSLVEKRVRAYFADLPVMIEIARCESNFRQYTDAGNVLYGAGGGMVGVFQFYEAAHQNNAAARGLDITTLDGNLKYARMLYSNEGTAPWRSSRDCWETNATVTAAAPATQTKLYSLSLKEEELLRQIDLLQQIIALLKQIQTLQLLLK